MAISVVCPNCSKKLKAKDELAGSRVKCPGCGKGILIPAMSAVAEVSIDPADAFLRAVEESDPQEIARLILTQDLTLIESPEESNDGHKAALIAEIDDCTALVAFTSEKHIRAFVEAEPSMLDSTGTLPAFVVSGSDFLEGLHEGCGVLLNAESDDAMLIPPELVTEIKQAASELSDQESHSDETPASRSQNKRSHEIRQATFAYLAERGFRPAEGLPLSDVDRDVRPAAEIAARLMSLAVVFSWVAAPSDAVPSEKVKDYIKSNRLRRWITDDEVKILSTPRADARKEHSGSIGWKLENMWPLAWILGIQSEPTIDASQINDDTSDAIIHELLDGLDKNIDELIRSATMRSADEVLALEDRFYCTHNAVRSAQLGEETVPEDFHPVIHGGAIHERRHALTWSLSTNTNWDDTDLST